MSEQLTFLQDLILALLLGGLIGLERERTRHKEDVHEFGGIRTMALISTFGYLVYSLFSETSLFPILTGGLILLLVASYLVSSYLAKNSGATTEIAGLFVYLIGVLMAMGELLYATVISLLVVLLLYFKKPLHRLAHRIAKEELYDTIKFIAVVFVVLPLLPNRYFGPMEVLNPYEIWLIVVLISTISFVSYIAIKFLGPKKGIGAGGFLGGLVSSTAVSMSFSHLSRKTPKVVNPFIFAILIACSAMFFRVLVTVSILNGTLLEYLLYPMLSMGFLGFILSAYYWFKKDGQPIANVSEADLNLKSPFQLRTALQFGLLFAALLFISRYALEYFGNNGILITAFFSGIVDVDAITVSLADLSRDGQITAAVATMGITIAAMTNTLSKAFIVFLFASHSIRIKVLLALLAMIGAGGLTLIFLLPYEYGAYAF